MMIEDGSVIHYYPRTRAIMIYFTGHDGRKCSAAVDLVQHPRGMSISQAVANAITGVIAEHRYGPGWIKDYRAARVM